MLFTPANRADMIEKAVRSGADAVIIDLEDSVSIDNKEAARGILESLPESPVPYFVRTNSFPSRFFWDDLIAAGQSEAIGVIVPKAEEPIAISQIDGALTVLEKLSGRPGGAITLVPLIESAQGVRLTYEISSASGRIECVMFGGGEQGDLVADLGVEWTPEGTGLLHARSQVLLSSRAAGVPHPMEAVFMDFRNLAGLRLECELARTLGYVGKVAIHPAQVPVINDVFSPSEEEVNYQRKILDAFEEAEVQGQASIAVDGRMVDYAVARVARTIIERAENAHRADAAHRNRDE